VNPSIESEFKGSGPRKVIKLGESCPCQATGLADEAEGRSNKSWPVFQLQDFYLRGVSPMTPSSKNFEKILEQSQTSQTDHLKV